VVKSTGEDTVYFFAVLASGIRVRRIEKRRFVSEREERTTRVRRHGLKESIAPSAWKVIDFLLFLFLFLFFLPLVEIAIASRR
tara:strand:- start:514 stop:762 length:249 start_codon:yes stop_codon:yes gene_type:complete